MRTYTPSEATEVLKCSADTVRSLCSSGKLRASRTGYGKQKGRWVIREQAIDDYLDSLEPETAKKTASNRTLPALSETFID